MSTVAVACFPYAGAGAGIYRRVRAGVPDSLRLVPVQLPGREERFGEALPATIHELAQASRDALLRDVAGWEAYAVLGHSFGAVVAYEVVSCIVASGARPPVRLVVSGAAGPLLPRQRRASALADDDLVAHLRDVGGYRDAALDDPDMRALLVPILRADITLLERYRPSAREPLPVPITALWGRDDRAVGRAEVQRWADVTCRDFALHELPGGHLHLVEHPHAYWAAVAQAVVPAHLQRTEDGR